jgi:hypothetical protein
MLARTRAILFILLPLWFAFPLHALVPTTFRDCADCPLMTRIPAGHFYMGSPADELADATGYAPSNPPCDWRVPNHRGMSMEQTPKEPVVCVSWPWGDNADLTRANTAAPGGTEHSDLERRWLYTSPVGSFPPNHFDLFDMLGNVWQWTADCENREVPGKTSDSCHRHVVRGGGWFHPPEMARSSSRAADETGLRVTDLGFRVARDDVEHGRFADRAVSVDSPPTAFKRFELHDGLTQYWQFIQATQGASADVRAKNFRTLVLQPNIEAYNSVAIRWFSEEENVKQFLKAMEGKTQRFHQVDSLFPARMNLAWAKFQA